MNKYIYPTLCFVCLFLLSVHHAMPQSFYADFKTDNFITIVTNTPPALIWVTDLAGRRTGADPNVPINNIGEQENGSDGPLMEIPDSYSEQENIANNDPNATEDNQSTMWTIDIKSNAKQTYKINLKGVTIGLNLTEIGGKYANTKGVQNNIIKTLAEPNVTRQLTMVFDPDNRNVKVMRVVTPEDIPNDVKIACQLNLISGRACRHLEEEADKIQKALENNKNKLARELLASFLQSLGENRQVGCIEPDDHGVVDSDVQTILKEEAQVLLDGLGTQGGQPGCPGNGDGGHGKRNR